MRSSVLVVALLSATSLPAQATVVQGGGAALQNAIDAASPGDVLAVQGGQYGSITIAGKGLTIDCGPNVFLGPDPGSVTVRDVPRGQTFAMRGGTVGGVFSGGAIRVENCAGAALFEGATLFSGRTTVTDCAHVQFRRTRVNLADVVRSNVAFDRCEFFQSFAPCLTIDASDVAWHACTQSLYSIRIVPAPGVELTSGRFTITGPPGTELFGMLSGPAIASAGGDVRADPDVLLVHGLTGPATLRVEPIAGTSASRPRAGTVRLDVDAPPGSAVLTALAAPTTPVGRLPWPIGTFWLGSNPIVVDAGTVPPSGVRTTMLSAAGYGAGEVTLVAQSVTLSSAGAVVLGTPSALLLN